MSPSSVPKADQGTLATYAPMMGWDYFEENSAGFRVQILALCSLPFGEIPLGPSCHPTIMPLMELPRWLATLLCILPWLLCSRMPCSLEIIFKTTGVPSTGHPLSEAVSAFGLIGFNLFRSDLGTHIRKRGSSLEMHGGGCQWCLEDEDHFCFLMTS